MNKPDWEKWLRFDLWTLRQATFLSLDIDPGTNPTQPESLPEEYIFREQLALTSHSVGKLETLDDTKLHKSQNEIYYKLEENPWEQSRGFSDQPTLHRSRCSKSDPRAIKETIVCDQSTNILPQQYIKWAIEKQLSVPNEMMSFVGEIQTGFNFGSRDLMVSIRRITSWYLKTEARLSHREIAEFTFPGMPFDSVKRAVNRDINEGAIILGFPATQDEE